MAEIIDGKKISAEVRQEIAARVKDLAGKNITPGLAVILVGEDPASQIYVRNKEKACQEIGIRSEAYRLPADTSEAELLELIGRLNEKSEIHGILVQLPVPKQIDPDKVVAAISPDKDVDGIHPVSLGNLVLGRDGFKPCTPYGCMIMLDKAGVSVEGKKAVVVGRSIIVGKPVALMLQRANATVTVCHSRTKDLGEETRQADILVLGTGRPGIVTGEMVKPGAVVIDAGTSRLDDGRLVGDADFESVSAVAGKITPVPGGVGPMTITMLLYNTVEAAERLC